MSIDPRIKISNNCYAVEILFEIHLLFQNCNFVHSRQGQNIIENKETKPKDETEQSNLIIIQRND